MEWITLPQKDKIHLINQVSIQTGISPAAVEKDWWVTLVLRTLFSMPFAPALSFKGGTSLSKGANLIRRFSEDIDIALDREYLGFPGELTKTQISDKLRRAACTFTRHTLKPALESRLREPGINPFLFEIKVNLTQVTTVDPETIEIRYCSLFTADTYLPNRVLIEVGGRSATEPSEEMQINSMISQAFPWAPFAEPPFAVKAVSPKRTFLEKAFLLHEEFAKEEKDIRTQRMSRHLYDLEKLSHTLIAQEALADTKLYFDIVKHREKFIGLKGMDYSTLHPRHLSFIPPPAVIEKWQKDYESMQTSMIYGDSLPFDALIERIRELNARFRTLQIPEL